MVPATLTLAVALAAAAAVLWAARTNPKVRGWLPLPIRRATPAEEAAVEEAEARAAEETPRDVGDLDAPSRIFFAWCVPCQALLRSCCVGHLIEHARTHATDLALWERELTDRSL